MHVMVVDLYLRAACCVLRAACCVMRPASCVLRPASCAWRILNLKSQNFKHDVDAQARSHLSSLPAFFIPSLHPLCSSSLFLLIFTCSLKRCTKPVLDFVCFALLVPSLPHLLFPFRLPSSLSSFIVDAGV